MTYLAENREAFEYSWFGTVGLLFLGQQKSHERCSANLKVQQSE